MDENVGSCLPFYIHVNSHFIENLKNIENDEDGLLCSVTWIHECIQLRQIMKSVQLM